jgi:regulator of sigma E protease
MTVLIFILVLIVLILVHEFGHFVVAKLSGMRVDEFGIGYPPRIWGKKYGETLYSINALPFGGFVKIYGEDETNPEVLASKRAFSRRPKLLQALTLVAGIAMNLLLAYVLITATLVMGTPRALSDAEIPHASNVQLAIAEVMPGSPAQKSGLMAGDIVTSISGAPGTASYSSYDTAAFVTYVGADTTAQPLAFSVLRNGAPKTLTITPEKGIIPNDAARPALGVSVATIGVIPESLAQAPLDGALYTWDITKQTATGLFSFFEQALTLHADLSQVSGPVGIAGAVGNAYAQGTAALMSIAAIISINLAIINLLPLPALDGGRLLFVIIEAILRRPIKPSVAASVNGIGFALLLLLMVVVTGSDVWKLVH